MRLFRRNFYMTLFLLYHTNYLHNLAHFRKVLKKTRVIIFLTVYGLNLPLTNQFLNSYFYFNYETVVYVFRPYCTTHTFYKRPGNRQSQSCGMMCRFYCIETVKELFRINCGQPFCRIWKCYLSCIIEFNLKVTVTVFYCITQEIWKNSGPSSQNPNHKKISNGRVKSEKNQAHRRCASEVKAE